MSCLFNRKKLPADQQNAWKAGNIPQPPLACPAAAAFTPSDTTAALRAGGPLVSLEPSAVPMEAAAAKGAAIATAPAAEAANQALPSSHPLELAVGPR